ncbi:MAG: hypothetical protein ACKO56_07040 [Paracoccaceae bacterium]
MVYIAGYVAIWVILLNALWLMYLAIYRPDQLASLLEGRSRLPGQRAFPQWRTNAHVISGLLGAFYAAFFIYRAALGFIPYEWGGTNADGEFHAMRDTIAGLLAFGTAYLVACLLTDGVELRDTIAVQRRNVGNLTDDLKTQRGELDDLKRESRALEAELEAMQTKHLREVRLLKDDILRLRSLISPDVLAEEDRKAAERANAPPKVYWS